MESIGLFETSVSNYAGVQKDVTAKKINNAERVSPNNPYLNKYIRFSDGTICFVTSRGVAKPFSNAKDIEAVYGNLGCPSKDAVVDIDMDWTTEFITGATIPTTPSLIVGTPMVGGTSCLYSGKNVFVSETDSTSKSNYVGCYKATDSMSDNSTVVDSLNQCFVYGADKGNKFSAAWRTEDGRIGCSSAANKDELISGGDATITYVPVALWSSNTSGGGNNAQITSSGQLLVQNASGDIVWTSPNAPDASCSNGGNISNVEATYGGNCNADSKYSVETGNATDAVDSKINSMMDNNSGIFDYTISISNAEFGDPAKGCNKSFDINYMCGNAPYVQHVDESEGKSIILSCAKEVASCNFALILDNSRQLQLAKVGKDDGERAVVWSPDTTATLASHPSIDTPWVAANGKLGQNMLRSGQTLFSGEWIGSPTGNIRLVMQPDGNLVLYTYDRRDGCVKLSEGDDRIIGDSTDTAAVYARPFSGNAEDLGRVAYIDADLKAKEYPADMLSTGTPYIVYPNTDSSGNDLSASAESDIAACASKCSDNGDCGGYVWDSTTKTCYLKKSGVYPKSQRTARKDATLGIKTPSIKSSSNCGMPPVNIDSVYYGSYEKGGTMSPDGTCHAKLVSSEDRRALQEKQAAINSAGSSIGVDINDAHRAYLNQSSAVDARQNKLNYRLDKYNMAGETNANSKPVVIEQFQNLTVEDLYGINSELGLYASSENSLYMALAAISAGLIVIAYNMRVKK